MAHFVKLNNDNIVINGVVINNDAIDLDNEEKSGSDFLNNLYGTNDVWKRTSYNAATNGFRFNYAGIGYTYDAELDAFYPPKCHDEAELNDRCTWTCTNAAHEID